MRSEAAPAPYPPSWYAASTPLLPAQPTLQGDVQADVCVLGAGYAGLTAALELAEAGLRVVVLEAQRIGWGASGRNGGQALVGYGCGEHALEALVGREDARAMFAMTVQTLAWMHARMARHGIQAHWQPGHATVPIKPRQVRDVRALVEMYQQHYDHPMQWWERDRLQATLASTRYRGAMFDPVSGHLHPLAWALGLGRAALEAGVRIFEGSAVTALEHGNALALRTAHGRVRCRHAFIAGNALLEGVVPALEARVMPVGTYIAATAPLGAERAAALVGNAMAVADTNWALDYFRLSHDHRLLFGGRASYSGLPPPRLAATMRRRMLAVFPQLRDVPVEYLWGGVVDISLNRAPHWGRLHPDVYFAQGFSGHGLVAASLAGRVVAEAITAQSHRLDVFARIPHRPFPGGRTLRTPLLVAAMSWYRLRDLL